MPNLVHRGFGRQDADAPVTVTSAGFVSPPKLDLLESLEVDTHRLALEAKGFIVSTAEDLEALLTPYEARIAALVGAQTDMATADVAALSTEQVAVLATADVAALSTEQVAAL